MDMRLIRTPHYYGQFALPLGKQSPYIFSKFNPLNRDTQLIIKRTLLWPLSVCINGFDGNLFAYEALRSS